MRDDWAGFEREALQILTNASGVAGGVFLLSFLQRKGLLWRWLEEPDRLPLETAHKIADYALLFDREFDLRLVERLTRRPSDPAVRLRLVELIERASRGGRALERITALVDDPDNRVRSKVTKLLGRIGHETNEAKRKLLDADPRVRAAAVEALWGRPAEVAREVFLDVLADAHHRVRGNGIVGLYKLDDPAALHPLRVLLEDPEDLPRRAGLWVIEQTRDPRFLPLVMRMMANAAPELRSRCLRAMNAIRQRRTEANEAGRFAVRSGMASTGARGALWPVWCESADLRALDFVPVAGSQAIDNFRVRRLEREHVMMLSGEGCHEPGALPFAAKGLAQAISSGLEGGAAHRILILTAGAAEEDWSGMASVAGHLVNRQIKVDTLIQGNGPSLERLRVLSEISGGSHWAIQNQDERARLFSALRVTYQASHMIESAQTASSLQIYSKLGFGECEGAQTKVPAPHPEALAS